MLCLTRVCSNPQGVICLTMSLVVQVALSMTVRRGLTLDRSQELLNVHAAYVVCIVVFRVQVALSMTVRRGLTLGRSQELLNARTVCVVYILVLTTHGVQVFPNQVYRLKTNLRLPP